MIERLLVNREELESVTDICDFPRELKHDSIEDQFRKIRDAMNTIVSYWQRKSLQFRMRIS